MKSSSHKGKDGGWATCSVPVKCLPEDCPAGQWQGYDGVKWEPQRSLFIGQFVPHDNSGYLPKSEAEVERETARVVKGSQHVRITGATGTNAGLVNGMYKPTEEMCGNVTVYVKIDDGNLWLEYHAATTTWQMKGTANKGENFSCANCIVPVKCLPEKCPPGQWEVGDGDKVVPQPAITIKQKKRER